MTNNTNLSFDRYPDISRLHIHIKEGDVQMSEREERRSFSLASLCSLSSHEEQSDGHVHSSKDGVQPASNTTFYLMQFFSPFSLFGLWTKSQI